MAKYETKLIGREEIAEDTMAFYFEKPEGFSFVAGQYVNVTLLHPSQTDWKGDVRPFSLASAPYEEHLMVATRMRDSAFKRELREMPLGSTVMIGGPFGNMTLPNDSAVPAVMLAGGIGITPFRSMVLQASRENLRHEIYLFYSNRTPDTSVFFHELQDLERRNPQYRFIPTMTKTGPDMPWNGETGYTNRGMMEAHGILDITRPVYYVAGPPAMVRAMERMLAEAGISEDSVLAEEFSGY